MERFTPNQPVITPDGTGVIVKQLDIPGEEEKHYSVIVDGHGAVEYSACHLREQKFYRNDEVSVRTSEECAWVHGALIIDPHPSFDGTGDPSYAVKLVDIAQGRMSYRIKNLDSIIPDLIVQEQNIKHRLQARTSIYFDGDNLVAMLVHDIDSWTGQKNLLSSKLTSIDTDLVEDLINGAKLKMVKKLFNITHNLDVSSWRIDMTEQE